MAQVITFQWYRPIPRYDSIPWTQARIEESADPDGPWTVIDTITLSPVDADPASPASRSFTTELADDAFDLWYQIVFLDGTGDESLPTDPVQNVAPPVTYATVEELARILKIRVPSDDQWLALQRALVAAAGEINQEIDLAANVDLEGWQLSLVAQVNLQRAAELWHLQEVPLGLAGIGSESGAAYLARNSWEKYAFQLAPLKSQWGLA
jgi:hypothetical protein